MGEVKIIGSRDSLFCTRVEWALKLKGVEYEYIQENVRNKSATLLEYNPVYKKIPVLVHNGKAICESLVILEYIEDTWKDGYSLMPQDSYDRAMARFWAKYVDEKCILTGVWKACTTEGEEKEKALEAVTEALAFLEKQIEGKKYFGGDEIGFLFFCVFWEVGVHGPEMLERVLDINFKSCQFIVFGLSTIQSESSSKSSMCMGFWKVGVHGSVNVSKGLGHQLLHIYFVSFEFDEFDEIGFLDLAVGWIPLYFSVLEEVGGVKLTIDQEKLPFLHEWCQNFYQIPLIETCLPLRQSLVDYLYAGITYSRSLATKNPEN